MHPLQLKTARVLACCVSSVISVAAFLNYFHSELHCVRVALWIISFTLGPPLLFSLFQRFSKAVINLIVVAKKRRVQDYTLPKFEEIKKRFSLDKVRVRLYSDKQVNAFSTPFEGIYISDAAIKLLSESEVVGMLAHELGHIIRFRRFFLELVLGVHGNHSFVHGNKRAHKLCFRSVLVLRGGRTLASIRVLEERVQSRRVQCYSQWREGNQGCAGVLEG